MKNRGRKQLNRFSIATKLKFWLYSILGLLIFVIPIRISGKSQIGLVHIGSIITKLLGPSTPYIIYAFALFGLVLIIKERKKRFQGFFNCLMSVLSLLGILCMTLYLLGFAPAFLNDDRFMPFIMSQVLYPTLLYTGISPFFMPFLLESGLLEFVGVALKPVLRPIYKLPGRAAIITASAFFGSAPVGIVVIDNLYKDGRFTYKEAFLMGTGFATTAISFMVILSNLGGISDYWGIYFFSCVFALLIIAAIMVRIYPTKSIPNTTYNDIPYVDESTETVEGNLFVRMLIAGYEKVESSKGFFKSGLEMVKTSGTLLCNIMASTCGMVVVGLIINYYTPILEWLGYIFYPFAWLAGLSDPLTIGKGAASGLLVPSLPAVYAAAASDIVSRIVLCSMPVLGIVSIPLTMPVFFNSTCKYSAKNLFIIYLERMVLTILLVAVIAKVCVWLFV